jgi:hypothetical protein
MIHQVLNRKGQPALCCDVWHLVHARFSVVADRTAPYERSIVSEHETREAGLRAARLYAAKLRKEGGTAPVEERDQLFLRAPGYVTSLRAARVRTKAR